MTTSRKSSLVERALSFFATIRSANAAAAAVEAGVKPRANDLLRLGIDAGAFGAIRRA